MNQCVECVTGDHRRSQKIIDAELKNLLKATLPKSLYHEEIVDIKSVQEQEQQACNTSGKKPEVPAAEKQEAKGRKPGKRGSEEAGARESGARGSG